ncbi:MAG: amidohydrolase family protein [Chloroflexi bacterium]|nr:amidohydrolase family protein [Chloroflexota bacterium]
MTAVQFENANVLTLDLDTPTVELLLVQDGLIQSPGAADYIIDLQGATVLPGFVDNHCHLLAMAAWESAVDCGPAHVDSIDGLIALLSGAESDTNSDWLVGVGYDDLLLAEGRHPFAADLDRVTTDQPLLLTHSSGHAHVANGRGLALLGIIASSDEPDGGTIDRIVATGEPSGLLLEMGEYISARLPRKTESQQVTAITSSLRQLASFGVTSATDAGHRNDVARLDSFVTASRLMMGAPRLRAMAATGIDRSELGEEQALLAGYTKVMLTRSGGRLSHEFGDLHRLVVAEHALGAPGIAIHAVEAEAVVLAGRLADVLRAEHPGLPLSIEHASEASLDTVSAVKRSGVTVVTQPGFVWSRGDRYIAGGAAAGNADDPYPMRRWLDANVPVAYGSDAPYGPAEPLTAIQAAVTRRSRTGRLVSGGQAIDIADALRLVTKDGDGRQRTLLPGGQADFVVLSDDPLATDPDHVGEIEVIATYVAGRQVWPEQEE